MHDRMQIMHQRAKLNVVLTTYEFLMGKLDSPRLSRVAWTHLILDEGETPPHQLACWSIRHNKMQ